jgi:hypothetical protein
VNLASKNYFKLSIPLGIIITLLAVFYQRSTGPTYPKKIMIGPQENAVQVKFLRSQGGTIDAPVVVPQIGQQMEGTLNYRRFPTNDPWSSIKMTNGPKGGLNSALPNQPPAGKLQYYLELTIDGQQYQVATANDPILIRYKGAVPKFILIPHIFFMFMTMLLSMIAAVEAVRGGKNFFNIAKLATGSLAMGGLLLGPLVQKYAFGVYWAGFPYDWDLTDNKVLVAAIFWFLACAINFKKRNPASVVIAALVLFAIFSIPHSMMGSQYNYQKGQIETDR